MTFGSTSDVYPEIVNALSIENIILNAYADDKKLNRLPATIQKSKDDLSKIVKHLEMDMAFLIYPKDRKSTRLNSSH